MPLHALEDVTMKYSNQIPEYADLRFASLSKSHYCDCYRLLTCNFDVLLSFTKVAIPEVAWFPASIRLRSFEMNEISISFHVPDLNDFPFLFGRLNLVEYDLNQLISDFSL